MVEGLPRARSLFSFNVQPGRARGRGLRGLQWILGLGLVNDSLGAPSHINSHYITLCVSLSMLYSSNKMIPASLSLACSIASHDFDLPNKFICPRPSCRSRESKSYSQPVPPAFLDLNPGISPNNALFSRFALLIRAACFVWADTLLFIVLSRLRHASKHSFKNLFHLQGQSPGLRRRPRNCPTYTMHCGMCSSAIS